ncbi:MAG: hypothetical protein QNJ13_09670 [Paracoccaceae bacterium]|nr:hypothetical protein [Paracoccaceae bacterium]
MSHQESQWIVDLAHRFPAVDRDALCASAGDVKRLVDHLAACHDLTLAEAAEAIEEWQFGLASPALPQHRSAA